MPNLRLEGGATPPSTPALPHHGMGPDVTCVAQLQAVEASILVSL